MILPIRLKDSYGRAIRDLRLSITDRCNFRCFYCMPTEAMEWKPKPEILRYEEIIQLAEIFVGLGVNKLRVTGGEPMVRRDLESLIERLARIEGLADLAMTTNAHFLRGRAQALKDAGLQRITISLDSLEAERFALLTGRNELKQVLDGIDAALEAGLAPVKVNSVVIRGINDDQAVSFAAFARDKGVQVRFIEFMPLDNGKVWRREMIVPGEEVRQKINAVYPLEPVVSGNLSETARRWRFADGAPGEVGFINPVTQPFCGHCSRIRLTADGMIRTCLFSTVEHNIKALLRRGAPIEELLDFIVATIEKKEDRHHINDPEFVQPLRTMSCIGG
ncbi:MAG: GTP 3',8-cyclase MoaA [Acidobacteria bacterium]|nr:GTP 3',8-cyclase MoaA [Acidobacteriota bacterium]MBI3427743.1 GTP 3',8-cyclase MoaA [Acidobacteriota bacterium]